MEVKSPSFKQGASIPKKYTCQGEDLSPSFTFHNLPEGTRSLAIIVEDPDAPSGTFIHWLGWNLNPTVQLDEGKAFPIQGNNGYGQVKYRGPCPPAGQTHRYFFKFYALDALLDLPSGSSKSELEQQIKVHALDHAEWMGTYKKLL